MAFGEALDAVRRIEFAPFRAQIGDGVAFAAQFGRYLADELGLLTTGSADFHGRNHGDFSEFRKFRTYGLEVRLGTIRPGV